jgi:hypothetical protein
MLLSLLATACGDDPGSSNDSGPVLAEQWAGPVEGTDAYVSVFTLDDGQAGAYVADGADVAALVLGTTEDGSIDLRPSDEVEVVVGGGGGEVSGTVTLDGEPHPFTAAASTGAAGWYRVRTEVDGDLVSAGYIVLADGTQRGAVRRGDEVIAAPELDTTDPVVDVEGVGTLRLLPVADFVEQERGLA